MSCWMAPTSLAMMEQFKGSSAILPAPSGQQIFHPLLNSYPEDLYHCLWRPPSPNAGFHTNKRTAFPCSWLEASTSLCMAVSFFDDDSSSLLL